MRQKYLKMCVLSICINLFLSLPLQGFRVVVASMESAIQATREFLGNRGPQVNLVNGATRGFQGFVTSPCAIRPTTSGNITAKVLMSDDIGWQCGGAAIG